MIVGIVFIPDKNDDRKLRFVNYPPCPGGASIAEQSPRPGKPGVGQAVRDAGPLVGVARSNAMMGARRAHQDQSRKSLAS
ncbi:hypothetical protein ACLJK8_04750 [Amaricoccus sp. W119]